MNILRKIPVLATAFCFAAAISFAADDSGIIDGPGYSFTISAAAGWHMTSTSQLQAAFFPAGSTFEKSPVIMYVLSASKAAKHVKTIDELNQLDLREMRPHFPKVESAKTGTARTKDGTAVPIYSFTNDGYFELVAYAEQPKTITVFTLSCDTAKELKASEKAFRALVASYLFISEDVKTSK